jgi:hypothetical protein
MISAVMIITEQKHLKYPWQLKKTVHTISLVPTTYNAYKVMLQVGLALAYY